MMAANAADRGLMGRLPPVRGRYRENVPLAPVTWFRVGGPAEVMFRPADADDLAAFRAALPCDVPVTVLGVGSNALIRDGGIPGVVIRLGRAFAGITIDSATVSAGAAALDVNVARAAGAAGLAGLEFLSGIPGTIGGGLRMNAGAYGTEIRDVLINAEAVDETGRVHRLDVAELGLAYRSCTVPEAWIFVAARLRARHGDPLEVAARMADIREARERTQPIRTRTGGSTFANPPGAKAWELIDMAGCRGLRLGDAQVSEQHCNFLVNTGTATAADLEALGEEVRRRVHAATGVELRWEIHRLGIPAEGPPVREVRS